MIYHSADLAKVNCPSRSKQHWHMVHFTFNLLLDWHYSKWYMAKAFIWIRKSELYSCRIKGHIGKKITLLMCLCVKLKELNFMFSWPYILFLTPIQVYPLFFLSCKAYARVELCKDLAWWLSEFETIRHLNTISYVLYLAISSN
jgi:hypothetical protein